MRMQWVGVVPESGEILTQYHHMFNRTDTTCCQIKMGMVAYIIDLPIGFPINNIVSLVAYLGVDHHMFNKTDTTCQHVNLVISFFF